MMRQVCVDSWLGKKFRERGYCYKVMFSSALLIYHRFIECVSKVQVKTDHDYRDYHAVSRAI